MVVRGDIRPQKDKMSTGTFPGVKTAEHRSNHSTSSIAVALKMWTLASTSPEAVLACNGDTFRLIYNIDHI